MRKEFTSKEELRKKLSALRQSVDRRAERAESAAKNLVPLLYGNVMIYVSIGSEMPTSQIIDGLLSRGDITVLAPYTVDGQVCARKISKLCSPDKHGNLPESCYASGSVEKIDVCVTPLLGFNSAGYRIGYGKGCYDRFFVGRDVRKIGFAFDIQLVDFENEIHDVPLDCCVTESGVVYFNGNASNIG